MHPVNDDFVFILRCSAGKQIEQIYFIPLIVNTDFSRIFAISDDMLICIFIEQFIYIHRHRIKGLIELIALRQLGIFLVNLPVDFVMCLVGRFGKRISVFV